MDPEKREGRRDRQAREVEQSQQDLRASIHKTQQLLDESEEMLRRHRREDAGPED
jgi:hypothetical protein